jgi:hypothetical protein
MPIFYNQGAPTPTTKNNINDIAVTYGIRDFLLNLNLAPQYPFISTTVNGSPRIGEPVLDTMVGSGALTVPIGLPLIANGLLFKDLNVINNTFQNDPSVANNVESINYIPDILNTDYSNSEWPLGGNLPYPTGANSQIGQYGILAKTYEANYKKANVIKNMYLDEAKQIDMASFIDLQPLNISQQIPSYLDVFGGLNQGGTAGNQAVNIIGSVLNGQGIGIGTNGSVVPNFDIRGSLAGRVLGATGLMKDTKLGTIGGQQLALALANNAAFNVQQDLLGALNIGENILNLIKDGSAPAFRPNYKITVAKSTGGKLLTIASSILGFQIPRSYLDDSGSIFQSENGDVANIDRANSMILNTGKGQVKSLISNVMANGAVNSSNNPFRSGYVPAYKDNKGKAAVTTADTKVYAYNQKGDVDKLLGDGGDVINSLNYLRELKTEISGFFSPDDLSVGTSLYGNKGYNNRTVNDVGFSWTTQSGALNTVSNNLDLGQFGNFSNPTNMFGDKKSLLVKTQKLFDSYGMKTLVSVKGEMTKNSSQIQTANGGGISKGSAVLKGNLYDANGRFNGPAKTAEDTYCRSWTTLARYDSVDNLIRHKGLYDKNSAPYRFKTKNSVLEKGGFVKIAPYIDDVPTDPKKFMFSIENLAWAGDPYNNLPQSEQGPGDLTTGKRGRIMWFPPYDIQFTENNTLDWESNKFIGRGEPVYTYNNTERSGTLSFKVIVDHPSYFNAFRGQDGPDDNYVASYFAGCVDPTEGMIRRLLTLEQIDTVVNEDLPVDQSKQDSPKPPTATLKVFFPNDNFELDQFENYENGLSGSTPSGLATSIDYTTNCDGFGYGIGLYPSNITQIDVNGVTRNWDDRYNFGLNWNSYNGKEYNINGKEYFGFFDPDYNTAMIDYLKNECKYCSIKVKGYASPQGNPDSNKKLAIKRAEYIVKQLKTKWGAGIDAADLGKRFKTPTGEAKTSSGCPIQTPQQPDPPTDILECKMDRFVEITVEYDPDFAAEKEKALQPVPTVKKEPKTVKQETISKFYNESKYFERLADEIVDPNTGQKLKEGTKFVFDSIREKIRYFHPAFHSTTPEGLNSRLTFLLQCTRQGPTLEQQGATNLAFGRAPICILRIGDFYNTKIIMENVNIDYEPLVWDLNPEGIGVQPMIANVDISFKFLGGSSLFGPINKLQNALSFNYFANTHVYDPRADYVAKKAKISVGSVGENDASIATLETNSNNVKATEESGYRIFNGVEKYEPELGKILSQISDNNNKEVDQVKAEEKVNGGVENTVVPILPTVADDKDIINSISIDNYAKYTINDGTITVYLTYNKKGNQLFNLDATKAKIYKGQTYIINGSTKYNIGYISVTSNGANNGVLINSNDNASSAGVIVPSDIQNGQTFDATLNLEDYGYSSKVDELYQLSGSIIKIQWETDGSTQCTFNNNNGR